MNKRPASKLWMIGLLLSLACSLVTRATPTAVPVPTQSASDRQLKVFDAVFAAVRDQYVSADFGGVDWTGLGAQYRALVAAGQTEDEFAQTLRSLLEKLPAGAASYQTRAERLEQETQDQATYSGIGAFIAFRRTPSPHIVILSTIEGAPAARAGLLPHDSIYAINDAALTLADEATPTARIRGEAGTAVTITVGSPGEAPRVLALKREQIQAVDPLRGGNLSALSTAYYRLPVTAGSDLAPAIASDLDSYSQTVKLKGIVLDLRVAGSGGSWPLVEMLSLFGNGTLGEFYTRADKSPITVNGINAGGSQTLPLVLIVGADTSGMPEVFAAALQAAGRAVVVGQPTAGEVQGFDTIALPDGSRLFLATSSFRTTRGLDLARAGVKPDFPVDQDWDAYTLDKDPVLGEALSLIPQD
ncbi:MAG: S41 family peptidase [Anaerolineales bacterium]